MEAALASRPCEVLNVSVTGALVLVDSPLAIRCLHPFRMGVAAEAVWLTALAVRTTPSRETGWWETAITFGKLSLETHLHIAAMLTQLLQMTSTAHHHQNLYSEGSDETGALNGQKTGRSQRSR